MPCLLAPCLFAKSPSLTLSEYCEPLLPWHGWAAQPMPAQSMQL
jgi:hypothetical protein